MPLFDLVASFLTHTTGSGSSVNTDSASSAAVVVNDGKPSGKGGSRQGYVSPFMAGKHPKGASPSPGRKAGPPGHSGGAGDGAGMSNPYQSYMKAWDPNSPWSPMEEGVFNEKAKRISTGAFTANVIVDPHKPVGNDQTMWSGLSVAQREQKMRQTLNAADQALMSNYHSSPSFSQRDQDLDTLHHTMNWMGYRATHADLPQQKYTKAQMDDYNKFNSDVALHPTQVLAQLQSALNKDYIAQAVLAQDPKYASMTDVNKIYAIEGAIAKEAVYDRTLSTVNPGAASEYMYQSD